MFKLFNPSKPNLYFLFSSLSWAMETSNTVLEKCVGTISFPTAPLQLEKERILLPILNPIRVVLEKKINGSFQYIFFLSQK